MTEYMPSGHHSLRGDARRPAVAPAWRAAIQQEGGGQGAAALIFFEVI
ncbi:MAG TPA: hypothetical protein VLZ32_01355 [Rhodanobacter sp.]|nr:hypothetical protein [Rhodanobacter sp.]